MFSGNITVRNTPDKIGRRINKGSQNHLANTHDEKRWNTITRGASISQSIKWG
jgi:hypothetical protein